jgi:predicted alpha/beta-hydrolase family hydrolase
VTNIAGAVFFPGAGSSSTHSSLVALCDELSPLPVALCDFPYRRAGKRFPDKAPVLVDSVREQVRDFAATLGVETSSLVIGGRSMGGRMCSMAVTDPQDPLDVAGVVLISYPLHPPGKPEKRRTEHLPLLTTPTLCVSGTKDNFGTPAELKEAFAATQTIVTWHWIENGRHELARRDSEVAVVIREWIDELSQMMPR